MNGQYSTYTKADIIYIYIYTYTYTCTYMYTPKGKEPRLFALAGTGWYPRDLPARHGPGLSAGRATAACLEFGEKQTRSGIGRVCSVSTDV